MQIDGTKLEGLRLTRDPHLEFLRLAVCLLSALATAGGTCYSSCVYFALLTVNLNALPGPVGCQMVF